LCYSYRYLFGHEKFRFEWVGAKSTKIMSNSCFIATTPVPIDLVKYLLPLSPLLHRVVGLLK
jgi:hypothetical protein